MKQHRNIGRKHQGGFIQFLAFAGMAMGMMGKLEESRSTAAGLQASGDADRYSAAAARARAETVRVAYGQQELQQRREARLLAGEQRAAIAQSGTGMGGSNEDIARQSQVFAELDALNIRYAGELEYKGLRQQAEQLDSSAASKSRAAKSAKKAGFLGMGSSLLSGSSRIAGG